MSATTETLTGLGAFLLSGTLAFLLPPIVTTALSVVGGALLSWVSLSVLLGAPGFDVSVPWAVPGGAFHIALDPLAAIFLLPIGVVGALATVYGLHYWSRAEQPDTEAGVRAGVALLVAAMGLVVLARNGVLFIAAWEVMALSAFFLVATEHERFEARNASFVYLAASHISTLGLIWLFSRIAAQTGTFGLVSLPAGPATTFTLLIALVSFGLKAGFMPLHVWLPGAHASAPSHASALMSGVMLKVGVYGIVRMASLAAAPPVGFGALVLILGVVSGMGGVAFALGQHDLKRLLAYHSIENIGIILMGLGLALMGRSLGHPSWVLLGISGALLHVWNHALFKSLLFLAAGSVVHVTGTRSMDRLGGLAHGMPKTALLFLIGAVAIAGLPPLNGFVSELLIYLGLFKAALPGGSLFVAFAAPALAMIGALAVACFVKAFGSVFLGRARSEDAEGAHEPSGVMLVPMGVLATLCFAVAWGAPWLAPMLDRAAHAWAPEVIMPSVSSVAPLGPVAVLGVALFLGSTLIWLRRRASMRQAPVQPTWGCGYTAVSPRVQYTSSSFADTLVGLFSPVLRPERHDPEIVGPFPAPAQLSVHVDDVVLERVVHPVCRTTAAGLTRVRKIHSGKLNIYLLYVLLITVLLLLSVLPVGKFLQGMWL